MSRFFFVFVLFAASMTILPGCGPSTGTETMAPAENAPTIEELAAKEEKARAAAKKYDGSAQIDRSEAGDHGQ